MDTIHLIIIRLATGCNVIALNNERILYGNGALIVHCVLHIYSFYSVFLLDNHASSCVTLIKRFANQRLSRSPASYYSGEERGITNKL